MKNKNDSRTNNFDVIVVGAGHAGIEACVFRSYWTPFTGTTGHLLRFLLDTRYVFNWTLISQLILVIFLYNTIHFKSINY